MSVDILNKAAGTFLVWRYEPSTGGLFNRIRAQYLGEQFYSGGLNVDLSDVSAPAKRAGYDEMDIGKGDLSDVIFRCSAGLDFDPSDGTAHKIFLAVTDDGKTVYATSLTDDWTETNPTVDPTIDEPKMIQVNDFVMMIRGAAEPVVIDSSGNATVGDGSSAAPPNNAVDICVFLTRIWALIPGNPTRLAYSKSVASYASVQTDWEDTTASAIAGYLELSPEAGNDPIAIAGWNGTSLIVWFNRCIEEVVVDPTLPHTNSIRRPLEASFGCCSRDGVVAVGQNFYFPDQYGQIRSLQQTVNAEQAGVNPKPLSEQIKGLIPDRVNKAHLSKIRCEVYQDLLLVGFPLDQATEANAIAVYSLSHQLWEGAMKLKRPIRDFMLSNIDGNGDEIFFFDGGTDLNPTGAEGPLTKVYRMFSDSYSDNGTAITLTFETRAIDYGFPELNKTPEWLEVEVIGDAGAHVEASIQLNEDGIWHTLSESMDITGSNKPFISYPLTYPLVSPVAGTQRKIFQLGELTTFGVSRKHKIRISESTDGKWVAIAGIRMMARPQPYERMQLT